MQSHSIPVESISGLIHQVEQGFDTSGDYMVTIRVIGKVPHIAGSLDVDSELECYECDRYAALLARRERESYPNVAVD